MTKCKIKRRSRLKTFRVSFTDHRFYYYDVEATNAETAKEIAQQRGENGNEGTDHKNGSEYAMHESTQEVRS